MRTLSVVYAPALLKIEVTGKHEVMFTPSHASRDLSVDT